MTDCSKDKIRDLIRLGRKGEDELIRCLLKKCKRPWKYSEDLWFEAMAILIENVRQGKFEGRSNICTYLKGIANNLQKQEYKKEKERAEKLRDKLSSKEWEVESEVEKKIEEEYKQYEVGKVQSLLSQLDEKCRELFIAKYYERMSFEDYAKKTGEPAATLRQRHGRCLGKARVLLT